MNNIFNFYTFFFFISTYCTMYTYSTFVTIQVEGLPEEKEYLKLESSIDIKYSDQNKSLA